MSTQCLPGPHRTSLNRQCDAAVRSAAVALQCEGGSASRRGGARRCERGFRSPHAESVFFYTQKVSPHAGAAEPMGGGARGQATRAAPRACKPRPVQPPNIASWSASVPGFQVIIMRDAVRYTERCKGRRAPTQNLVICPSRVSVCAARALNATGQSRVTLSLR